MSSSIHMMIIIDSVDYRSNIQFSSRFFKKKNNDDDDLPTLPHNNNVVGRIEATYDVHR